MSDVENIGILLDDIARLRESRDAEKAAREEAVGLLRDAREELASYAFAARVTRQPEDADTAALLARIDSFLAKAGGGEKP